MGAERKEAAGTDRVPRQLTIAQVRIWGGEIRQESSDGAILHNVEAWRTLQDNLIPMSSNLSELVVLRTQRRGRLTLANRLAIVEAQNLRAAISRFELTMHKHGLYSPDYKGGNWAEATKMELMHEIMLLNVAVCKFIVMSGDL